MSQSVKTPRQTVTASFSAPTARTTFRVAAALVAGSLLAGCSYLKRDHVEVGAIPDDYRTNHPIVISERQEAIDIPVGPSDESVTDVQKAAVYGFLDKYEPAAGAVLQILIPSGSANQVAAAALSHSFADIAVKSGVPRHKIVIVSYMADSSEVAAPVRLSFNAMVASAGQCGRWPDDIMHSAENKHYANFGCSYQNNLAAQVANPADLLGPRKPSEIDAERRVIAIGEYREGSHEVRGDTSFETP